MSVRVTSIPPSTLLYTQKPCGCLVLVLVNEPDDVRACRSDINRELRAGRTLHEATAESLPPLSCSEHKGKRGVSKRVFGQPESET